MGRSSSPPRPSARATNGHPLFAALYDTLVGGAERRTFAPLREWVVGGAAGRVLEVGAGTGASFPYFRGAPPLVATEPDPYMRRRARRRADALRLAVELHDAPAEALPFPDGSFDAVICTLVLCTVDDPSRALAEARRVLRSGGTLRFIEHVRGEGLAGRVHDLVTPLWSRVNAGCHPNRRTAETIAAAGFDVQTMERGQLGPGSPLIAGVATRRERS